LNRNEFRRSLFDVVEHMTPYDLSHHARELLIHYFNRSMAPTSYEKARAAIEGYLQDTIPDRGQRGEKLEALLEKMKRQADAWDRE